MNYDDFTNFLYQNNLNNVFDVGVTASNYFSFPEAVSLLAEPLDGIYNAGDLLKFKKDKILINGNNSRDLFTYDYNLPNPIRLHKNKGIITDVINSDNQKLTITNDNYDYGIAIFKIFSTIETEGNVEFSFSTTIAPENISTNWENMSLTNTNTFTIRDQDMSTIKDIYYVSSYQDLNTQENITNPYNNFIYSIININVETNVIETLPLNMEEFNIDDIPEFWTLLFYNKKLNEISTAFFNDDTEKIIKGKTLKINFKNPYIKLNLGWKIANPYDFIDFEDDLNVYYTTMDEFLRYPEVTSWLKTISLYKSNL